VAKSVVSAPNRLLKHWRLVPGSR